MESGLNDWHSAPEFLELPINQVHVWRVGLDLPSERIDSLTSVLSPKDRERAERFHFEEHRIRYVTGRYVLRLILARYLSIEPEDVSFRYSDRGKPSLTGTQEKISFNMSDSNDLALFAFARDRPIGVDLEYVRSLSDFDELLEVAFTPRECVLIRSLPKNERQRAFFGGWTAKEAALKATGEGAAGLQKVEVILDANESGIVMGVRGLSSFRMDQWVVQMLEPASGYVGAVVTEGTPASYSTFALDLEIR